MATATAKRLETIGADCLAAALDYLALGWSVLPLAGKIPRVGWKRLQESPADTDTAKGWWEKWPTANVGMALGVPSCPLVGIDIDGAEGERLLQEASGGDLPTTLEFTRGPNSRRLLYRIPDGEKFRPMPAIPGTGEHSELRFMAKGSQTVLPPSLHASGDRYSWEPGHGPDDIDAAPAPTWLRERLLDKGGGVAPTNGAAHQYEPLTPLLRARVGAYLNELPRSIQTKNGSAALMRAARSVVWGFNIEPGAAFDILQEDYNPTCSPKWSDEELRHKIHDADTKPFDKPRGFLLGEPAGVSPEPAGAFPEPVPIEQLTAIDLDDAWRVKGLLGTGSITLFSALWKSGKTTFLAHVLKALGGDAPFVGLSVVPSRALVVSEEPAHLWTKRRDELGLKNHVEILCRPFLGKPSQKKWEDFLAWVAERVKSRSYNAVFLDTLSALWPVENENDAGEIMRAVLPLRQLSGAAVCASHHFRKGDGAEATAARGSGALPGFVDIILELRRFASDSPANRARVLTGVSRYESTPAELVIELAENGSGFVAKGSKTSVKQERLRKAILGILPAKPPGLAWNEILDRFPAEERSRKQDMLDTLRMHAGLSWTRAGEGTKRSPYLYAAKREKP
jgi:hypothetical protein